MKTKLVLVAAVVAFSVGISEAQTVTVSPASPQPSNPKPGLSVRYAWAGEKPAEIDNLARARSLLSGRAKPGKPLRGLDYRDTTEGDPVMTFNKAYNVAADIHGFIRFDEPGTYEIETWSNDGIEARISGQQVGYVRERQPCEANQRVEVVVPEAGWYDLDILYFQKYSTACLMMKWGKNGSKMKWVPNSAFAH